MKRALKIIILIFFSCGLFYVYRSKYTYPKSGEDYLLYLNPFQSTNEDFNSYFQIAEQKLRLGDVNEVRKYYVKALEFRETFNERQFEKIHSDANGLWDYKLDKFLKYSKAYEFIGELDSAISCLAPGMISLKWESPIESRFFELSVKKLGKTETIRLISIGLNNIFKIDKDACNECYECYYCCDYYYKFGRFKIGIYESDFIKTKTNKNDLIKELCEQYGV